MPEMDSILGIDSSHRRPAREPASEEDVPVVRETLFVQVDRLEEIEWDAESIRTPPAEPRSPHRSRPHALQMPTHQSPQPGRHVSGSHRRGEVPVPTGMDLGSRRTSEIVVEDPPIVASARMTFPCGHGRDSVGIRAGGADRGENLIDSAAFRVSRPRGPASRARPAAGIRPTASGEDRSASRKPFRRRPSNPSRAG